MFNLEILMQEMTTNVIKQTINVGFGTPNQKTWNISQLQKEAWKQVKAAPTTTPCNFILISHVWFILIPNTVNTLMATTSRKRPPSASDHFADNRFASQSTKMYM